MAPRVERLAYTRSQVAEALGVSRATFLRRILPHIETIEMPWGTRLIPVDELERLIAERRRPARPRPAPAPRGRPRQLPEQTVERIQAAHSAGRSLGEIARELNADAVPTAQGGRPESSGWFAYLACEVLCVAVPLYRLIFPPRPGDPIEDAPSAEIDSGDEVYEVGAELVHEGKRWRVTEGSARDPGRRGAYGPAPLAC